MAAARRDLDDPPARAIAVRDMDEAIPTFYLYGEPHRSVDAAFIHVEPLDDRSRPSEWTIRPHAHEALNHIILIADGGGTMQADGETLSFTAPALLVVPAALVHGFAWTAESRGWVATLAQDELMLVGEGDAEIGALFAAARAVALTPEQRDDAEAGMTGLARELGWSQPGRHAALRGALLGLIALALRAGAHGAGAPAPGRQARLVARLRGRIEARFRLREPVARHAAALGVSESALRGACARITGQSPAAMLDQRAALEARRLLLYSTLPVAQIGYGLGFDDPAYFSRFFKRQTGESPGRYRAGRRG